MENWHIKQEPEPPSSTLPSLFHRNIGNYDGYGYGQGFYPSSHFNFSQNFCRTESYNPGFTCSCSNHTQSSSPPYFPPHNFIGSNQNPMNVNLPNSWPTLVDQFDQANSYNASDPGSLKNFPNSPYASSAMTFGTRNLFKDVQPDNHQNFSNSPFAISPMKNSRDLYYSAFVKCEYDDESQVSTTCQDFSTTATSGPSNYSKNSSGNDSCSGFVDALQTKTDLLNERVCINCEIKKTVLWRKVEGTGPYICNACGLYRGLHGVSRPKRLWKKPFNHRKSKPKVAKGRRTDSRSKSK